MFRNQDGYQPPTAEDEVNNRQNKALNHNINKIGRARPKIIRFGKPGHPMKQYNIINLFDANEVAIPETLGRVYNNKYSKEWLLAMDNKYKSLLENNTFTLVDLPPGQKAIGCRCI